jgi:hypothetical protein
MKNNNVMEILADILEELFILSLLLQNQDITLVYADRLVRKRIEYLYVMRGNAKEIWKS